MSRLSPFTSGFRAAPRPPAESTRPVGAGRGASQSAPATARAGFVRSGVRPHLAPPRETGSSNGGRPAVGRRGGFRSGWASYTRPCARSVCPASQCPSYSDTCADSADRFSCQYLFIVLRFPCLPLHPSTFSAPAARAATGRRGTAPSFGGGREENRKE